MSGLAVVAVVGRPNVGKSTLVNRILGRREAVVQARPGVTRDRKEYEAEWAGRRFLLIDTGGGGVSPGGELTASVRVQTEAALAGADVVLFVTDARVQIGEDDAGVADLLRRSGAPVLVVANKVDDAAHELDLGHLWGLGLGEPIPVSALHGRGSGDLLDRLVKILPGGREGERRTGVATLAILGRPNVGKSTLLNRLAGEERVLVSPQPGTTRDSIDVVLDLDGEPFRVVDTAGIRRASKVDESAEFYSVLRARKALEEADVVLLMIDGIDGASQQDQRLAEEIAETGAGLVVLLNKWDVATREEREEALASVGDRLAFVGWAPVLTLSALTGSRANRIGRAVREALTNRRRRIPTGELNRLVRGWQEAHPPPTRKGRRPKILYAVQAGQGPPTIVLFVAGGELGPDYLRYLENRLRETHPFVGSPIRLVARRRAATAVPGD